jgi:hypothetical protein
MNSWQSDRLHDIGVGIELWLLEEHLKFHLVEYASALWVSLDMRSKVVFYKS